MSDLVPLDKLDQRLAEITDPADAAQLARDFLGLRAVLGERKKANRAVLGYAKAARRTGELLSQITRERGVTAGRNRSSERLTTYQEALDRARLDRDTAHRYEGLSRVKLEAWQEWVQSVEEGRADAALKALLRPSVTPKTTIDDPLPPGTYRVLYVDPPWRYDFAESGNREIENQYYTLDLDELKELTDAEGRHVKTLAAEDAVLFMWATSPKLEQAIDLIPSWGFEYRTSLVWVKDKIGMGYYARQRHELLLVAKRGEPAMPEPSQRPDSVISAPRTQHSEKPEVVYQMIEAMFPGPYVELFSRESREGWAAWGTDGLDL